MELNEFIADFAEQFDDTDVSEINASTEFQNLEEWGSLVAMGVIAFVRTEYGKSITGPEIRSCKTVEDLYNYIRQK